MRTVYSDTHLSILRPTKTDIVNAWTHINNAVCFCTTLFSISNSNTLLIDRHRRKETKKCSSTIVGIFGNGTDLFQVVLDVPIFCTRRRKHLDGSHIASTKLWHLDLVICIALLTKNRNRIVQLSTTDVGVVFRASAYIKISLLSDLPLKHVRCRSEHLDLVRLARSEQSTNRRLVWRTDHLGNL